MSGQVKSSDWMGVGVFDKAGLVVGSFSLCCCVFPLLKIPGYPATKKTCVFLLSFFPFPLYLVTVTVTSTVTVTPHCTLLAFFQDTPKKYLYARFHPDIQKDGGKGKGGGGKKKRRRRRISTSK